MRPFSSEFITTIPGSYTFTTTPDFETYVFRYLLENNITLSDNSINGLHKQYDIPSMLSENFAAYKALLVIKMCCFLTVP